MADVKVLTEIVPEELVEEAKVEYEKYIKNNPERELTLDSFTSRYVKIFVLEEEIGVKEKFLEILKKEIAESKSSLEVTKHFIGIETKEDDKNIFSHMVFNDILEILFKDGFDYYSSEEELKYMLGFYFNNIRDIEKEFNFITEVKNIIKEKEASEEEVPDSLVEFYEIIEPFYYESKIEV